MEVVVDKLTAEGKKFMKELEELGRLQVRVGFQRGLQISQADGTDMCDIAAWNELGTNPEGRKGIPSRPFMRDSVDKHADEVNRMLEEQAVLLTRGVSAKQILQNLGEFQKGMIQQEILDGEFEPNRRSTIEKKKSDKPLIDTGHMLQSVNYQICQRGEYD